jgi:hypothetical protein
MPQRVYSCVKVRLEYSTEQGGKKVYHVDNGQSKFCEGNAPDWNSETELKFHSKSYYVNPEDEKEGFSIFEITDD